LEEARLSLLVQAIGVELQLGNHYLLLGELAALTDRHPLHEALHQMYMVALYRTGHPDRALRVYGRLRAALDESLGLDPLGSVERLRGALLVASPALEPAPVPVG
jgi:DNA-binding SARP family transcriptional activator